MSAKAGVRRDPDGIWFDGQVGGNGVGSGVGSGGVGVTYSRATNP